MEFAYWSLLTFLSLISIVSTFEYNPCSMWRDSLYANGKCFLLLSLLETFDDAETNCRYKQSTVAEVRSPKEKDVLLSVMRTDIPAVWIGLKAQSMDGTYVWNSDQVPLNSSSSAWNITCSRPTKNADDGDCVMMLLDGQFVCSSCWSTTTYVACERYIGNPCDLFLPGAEFYSGRCFLFDANPLTAEDAQAYCETMSAFLVEPKTSYLQTYLSDFASRQVEMNNIPSGIHIGGISLMPGNWSWRTSGERFTDDNWNINEPNKVYDEQAVVMFKRSNWKWNNIGVSGRFQLICQRDIGDPCENDFSGAVYMFGSCVKHFSDKLSWIESQAACKGQGSFLAEPKTKEMADAVARYFLDITGGNSFAWLGGTNKPDGQWGWATSGEAITNNSSWNAGEPNNAPDPQGPEVCMVVLRNGDFAGWNDIAESHLWTYMCQKDLNPLTFESYLAVLPSFDNITRDVASLHVTTSLQSSLVYLKFVSSSGHSLRSSASYTRHFVYRVEEGDLLPRSTGSHEQHVVIEASNTVTVVASLVSADTNVTSMTLIYPMSWFKNASWGNSNFAYCDRSGNNLSSSLAVTAITDVENDVTLYLPKGSAEESINVNRLILNLRNGASISARLNQRFQTLYVTGLNEADGIFADSLHPVTMFVHSQNTDARTGFTQYSYNQVLPIHFLDLDYIAFPVSQPDAGFAAMLKVIAVHNETNIVVHGSATQSSQARLHLPLAGNVNTVSVPGPEFQYVTSDKPFYAVMYPSVPDSVAAYSCMTPLLPRKLWRHQYDFSIDPSISLLNTFTRVIVIVERRTVYKLKMTPEWNSLTCTDISDTALVGCYVELDAEVATTYYHIYHSAAAPFAAYFYSSNGQSCVFYPLGVVADAETTNSFDKEAYLYALLKPESCVADETTTPGQQTTEIEYTTPTERTEESSTERIVTSIFFSSTDFVSPTTNMDSSTSEGNSTTMEVNSTTAEVNSTTAEVNSTTADIDSYTTEIDSSTAAIGSSTSQNINTTAERETTTTIKSVTYNISMDLQFEIELANLHIDRKLTVSYRHSKVSVDDCRISATAIGVCGVVVVVAVVCMVVVNDIINLCNKDVAAPAFTRKKN